MDDKHLVVCVNQRLSAGQKSCAESGSRNLISAIKWQLSQAGVDIPVVEQVCLGRCSEGVAMRIAPGGPFFTQVTEQDVEGIIRDLINF